MKIKAMCIKNEVEALINGQISSVKSVLYCPCEEHGTMEPFEIELNLPANEHARYIPGRSYTITIEDGYD